MRLMNFLKANKLIGNGYALNDNTKSRTVFMLPQYKKHHDNSLGLRAILF